MKQAFILADGARMPSGQMKKMMSKRFFIALDGSAERAKKERWLPDLILGDFDTVKPATLKYFAKKGCEIHQALDQNHTDLEKALAWCALRDFSSIWVAQALGNRLDHSLTNLVFLKRFFKPGQELFLFTETEKIRFVRNQKLRVKGRKNRAMAVIPFSKCVVKSKGLAFEMDRMNLELGLKESVSNQCLGQMVDLDISGEALVIEGL